LFKIEIQENQSKQKDDWKGKAFGRNFTYCHLNDWNDIYTKRISHEKLSKIFLHTVDIITLLGKQKVNLKK